MASSVKFQVRLYKTSDLARLKKLLSSESWYLEFASDDHYARFVAVSKGEIVGFAAASITLGTANLDFIFIDEAFRSRGVGKSLLQYVEKYCVASSAFGLGVNCGAENKRAQEFYVREGFKLVGKVYNYFSNDNWQFFFHKKL